MDTFNCVMTFSQLFAALGAHCSSVLPTHNYHTHNPTHRYYQMAHMREEKIGEQPSLLRPPVGAALREYQVRRSLPLRLLIMACAG